MFSKPPCDQTPVLHVLQDHFPERLEGFQGEALVVDPQRRAVLRGQRGRDAALGWHSGELHQGLCGFRNVATKKHGIHHKSTGTQGAPQKRSPGENGFRSYWTYIMYM